MTCPKCNEALPLLKISTPSDLRKAIAAAKHGLDTGCLNYEGTGSQGDPFHVVTGLGWGDFVSNYFSCLACGQWFHLHAETYHGAGGALERVLGRPDVLKLDEHPV